MREKLRVEREAQRKAKAKAERERKIAERQARLMKEFAEIHERIRRDSQRIRRDSRKGSDDHPTAILGGLRSEGSNHIAISAISFVNLGDFFQAAFEAREAEAKAKADADCRARMRSAASRGGSAVGDRLTLGAAASRDAGLPEPKEGQMHFARKQMPGDEDAGDEQKNRQDKQKKSP